MKNIRVVPDCNDDGTVAGAVCLDAKGMRHVTFANSYYVNAAKKLSESAKRYGLSTKIYGPDDFDEDFLVKHSHILKYSRGYGYMVWKPWIIIQELKKMKENELLLYTDAACEFVSNPEPLFELSKRQEVVVFEVTGHPERNWTKSEVFEKMNISFSDQMSDQRMSSFIVFRNCEYSRTFVLKWMNLASDLNLIGEETKLREEYFVAHRHDQSLLSVLSKKFNLSVFRDPSQFGNCFIEHFTNSDYGCIINHHRKAKLPIRNRIEKSVYPKINFFVRKYLKIKT